MLLLTWDILYNVDKWVTHSRCEQIRICFFFAEGGTRLEEQEVLRTMLVQPVEAEELRQTLESMGLEATYANAIQYQWVISALKSHQLYTLRYKCSRCQRS